jgi:hypothetical protein
VKSKHATSAGRSRACKTSILACDAGHKVGGYKVVHLIPHQTVTTLPKYDEMVTQKDKLSANNGRPEGSVLHTIGEYVGSPAPATG